MSPNYLRQAELTERFQTMISIISKRYPHLTEEEVGKIVYLLFDKILSNLNEGNKIGFTNVNEDNEIVSIEFFDIISKEIESR